MPIGDNFKRLLEDSGVPIDDFPPLEHQIERMNKNGFDWCMQNFDKLVKWVEKNRDRLSLALEKGSAKKLVYTAVWSAKNEVPPTIKKSPLYEMKNGPGTELKIILSRFGFRPSRNCKCDKRAVIMDERGETWCEDNIETIVGWLKEEATIRHLLFNKALGRMLIKRAIRNSRKRKQRVQEIKAKAKSQPQKKKTVNSMKWAYGITTVPKRLNDLLPRTIASLKKAGFDKPRLFVDGTSDTKQYERFGLEITTRNPPIKTFANWILALAELYLREPQSDRYAIFQDDLVAYINLRKYLDRCKYPEKGYWNLYTFPQNQKLAPKNNGWFLSNQRGKGAVAIVLSRDAVTTLLKQNHIIDRPKSAGKRRFQVVDGAIVDAFRKTGWKEYTHNPSLVQHTGKKSSIRNRVVPDSWQAISFKGEDFDAMEILK